MFERRAKKAQNMLFRYITTTAGAGSTFAETLELVVSLDSFYFKNNGSFLMDDNTWVVFYGGCYCGLVSQAEDRSSIAHKMQYMFVLYFFFWKIALFSNSL